MRVWIVNPFDNLPGEGYRAGRYEMMARAFVAVGDEVVWWSSDWSHTKKQKRACTASGLGFSVRLVPTRPYRRNVSFARLRSHRALARDWARMAALEAERPDLVIASAPPLALANAALGHARRVGARFVVDVQDAWPETFYRLLPRGSGWLGPALFAPLHAAARRLYREADLVTGVCDRYAALVRKAGAKAYRRAYLGIDVAAAQTDVPPAAPHPGVLRLVYLGNLGRGYDLATVRAAVAGMPDVTLDIAGAAEPRREGRVTWHGYLGDVDLRRLLAVCDIGVIPMRADSFVGLPNKIADYAAAGLAVVSTLAGECADLLDRTGAGVTCPPGDVAALQTAIRRAAACRAQAAALAHELDAAAIYPAYVREVRGF